MNQVMAEAMPVVRFRQRVRSVRWLPLGIVVGMAVTAATLSAHLAFGGRAAAVVAGLSAGVVVAVLAKRLAASLANEVALAERIDGLAGIEAQLRDELTVDDLTRALNRRHFMELGRAAVATASRYRQPLSLLMLDIDRFKEINDHWGHRAGDEALCRLTDAIRVTIRDSDLVARIGGDEFVVLLPNTDAVSAALVADRLREQLALDPDEPTLTVSVGAADLPADAPTLDALLRRADVALFQSKRAGRNRVSVIERSRPQPQIEAALG